MIVYTKIRELGNGVCSICRLRREKTLHVARVNGDKTINRRWCQECFELAKLAAECSADISR